MYIFMSFLYLYLIHIDKIKDNKKHHETSLRSQNIIFISPSPLMAFLLRLLPVGMQSILFFYVVYLVYSPPLRFTIQFVCTFPSSLIRKYRFHVIID